MPSQDRSSAPPAPARALLRFWFEDIDHEHWFGKSAAFDREIEQRFRAELEAARRGELDGWAESPRGTLALIVLLDQFSRNIFRDTPAAFEADAMALDLTIRGIEAGYDVALTPAERQFFYMPLMHAENLEAQRLSLEKARELVALGQGSEKYARAHHEIIAQFGRFPHRNRILGRLNTPAEDEYLKDPRHRGF